MTALSDIAAERAVLAGIIKHGEEAFLDVYDIVKTNTFTLESNQVIFKCIHHIFQEKEYSEIDIPSIYSAANSLGLTSFFNKTSEKAHLKGIMLMPVHINNVRRFAGQIRKLEVTRLLIGEIDDAKQKLSSITGDESMSHILGIVENPIFNFASLIDDDSESKILGEGLEDYISFLENNAGSSIGVPTGFKYYDAAIGGGLRPRSVNLIGARTKTGKSMVCSNIALHITKELNIPVLVLDTEMSKEDYWARSLACLSRITLDEIELGSYKSYPDKKLRIDEAVKIISKIPYTYHNVVGLPFEDIVSIIRRWVTKKKKQNPEQHCVIIYDWLKSSLAEAKDLTLQEWQALGYQMSGLHNICERYAVPCLSFTQLNREGEISQSDRLLWFSSSFCILKNKSPEEQAEDGPENGNKKLIPRISRYGPDMSNDYINFMFEGKYAKFRELNMKSNMHENNTIVDMKEEVKF